MKPPVCRWFFILSVEQSNYLLYKLKITILLL